jgi:hypothetical protein
MLMCIHKYGESEQNAIESLAVETEMLRVNVPRNVGWGWALTQCVPQPTTRFACTLVPACAKTIALAKVHGEGARTAHTTNRIHDTARHGRERRDQRAPRPCAPLR